MQEKNRSQAINLTSLPLIYSAQSKFTGTPASLHYLHLPTVSHCHIPMCSAQNQLAQQKISVFRNRPSCASRWKSGNKSTASKKMEIDYFKYEGSIKASGWVCIPQRQHLLSHAQYIKLWILSFLLSCALQQGNNQSDQRTKFQTLNFFTEISQSL